MKYLIKNCFVNISNSKEYIEIIQEVINSKKKTTFFYLNSYSFYLANKNKQFKNAFNKADYIIADGYSILLLFKILKKIEIDKVVFTYSFFDKLHKIFNNKKLIIYLLGGTQTILEKSVKILKHKFHIMNIGGYSNGYFNIETGNDAVVENINKVNPDILICGMGMPRTELWIQNNFNRLNVNCIFSVGGFFDFLVRDKKIAPKWMYNSGFEWICRLIQEPRRLFRRYLLANSYLIYYMLKTKLRYAIKKN